MAVAVLTGRCWHELAASVPGFRPAAERQVCFVGLRDMDPLETEFIAHSAASIVHPDRIEEDLESVLDAALGELDEAYVHLDLDVLDESEGRPNASTSSGGLTLDETLAAVRTIGRRVRITGAALTAYDPSLDEDGRVCRAALALAEAVVGAARP